MNIAETKSAAIADDLVARARALAPTLRERAAHTEELRRVPEETMATLHAEGLLKFYQPKRYGGFECDWGTHFRLGREVAKACPATMPHCAWSTPEAKPQAPDRR